MQVKLFLERQRRGLPSGKDAAPAERFLFGFFQKVTAELKSLPSGVTRRGCQEFNKAKIFKNNSKTKTDTRKILG